MRSTALVGVLAALASTSAMHIAVPPHQDECFYETVEGGNKLSGSFEVLTGGLLDIDVSIVGPSGEAHYAVQRQQQGHFTVMAKQSGLYRICFSNKMSTLTEKTVAFSTHIGDKLYQDIAKQEHISPLESEIMQLADTVESVEDSQRYLWARERAARSTNESTNARVAWFSVMELVTTVVVAGVQIYFLRRFFEKRRRY